MIFPPPAYHHEGFLAVFQVCLHSWEEEQAWAAGEVLICLRYASQFWKRNLCLLQTFSFLGGGGKEGVIETWGIY